MAFKARVGAANFPVANDTIHVYETGTTNLVTGLINPNDGTSLSNPFNVPQHGWYGFELHQSKKVDVWWVEADEYLITAFDPYDYVDKEDPFPQYLKPEEETDPIFSAWDKSTGISITKSQISDFVEPQIVLEDGVNIKTIEGESLLGSGDLTVVAHIPEETDPIFIAWDKSTGISITKSQISDLGDYQEELVSGDNIKTVNNESLLGSGDLTVSMETLETDPIFSAWNRSEGITIKENQILDFGDYQEELVSFVNIKTIDGESILGSGNLEVSLDTTETDPVFTAWDKSTGISITESQVTDLGDYQEELVSGTNIKTINGESVLGEGNLDVIPEETDPIFTAWDKSTGITITEFQITDFGNYQEELVSGTNIKIVNGESLLGSGDLVVEPNETDPIFTAWDKSTGITITENQVIDLGNYQNELITSTNIRLVNDKDLLGSGNLEVGAKPAQDGGDLVELVDQELGTNDWQNRTLGERRTEIGGILRTCMGNSVDDTYLECNGLVFPNAIYPDLAPMMPPHSELLDGFQWNPFYFDMDFFGTTYNIDQAIFNQITKNTSTGEYITFYDSVYDPVNDEKRVPVLTSMDGVNWSLKGYLSASYHYRSGNALELNIIDLIDIQYIEYIDKYMCIHGNGFLYSDDGVTWQGEHFSYHLGASVGEAVTLTHSNELGVIVCVGSGDEYYDSSQNTYKARCNSFYSYDGLTWHRGSIYSGNRSFNVITWSPELNLFVALGRGWNVVNSNVVNNDGYYWIAVSPNGESWSEYQGFVHDNPTSIIWSAELNKFYATAGGNVYESVDGVSWTKILDTNAAEILWLPSMNKLVILFNDGELLGFSADGNSWQWVDYTNTTSYPSIVEYNKYYDDGTQRIYALGGYFDWGIDAFQLPNIPSIDGEITYIKAK